LFLEEKKVPVSSLWKSSLTPTPLPQVGEGIFVLYNHNPKPPSLGEKVPIRAHSYPSPTNGRGDFRFIIITPNLPPPLGERVPVRAYSHPSPKNGRGDFNFIIIIPYFPSPLGEKVPVRADEGNCT